MISWKSAQLPLKYNVVRWFTGNTIDGVRFAETRQVALTHVTGILYKSDEKYVNEMMWTHEYVNELHYVHKRKWFYHVSVNTNILQKCSIKS